MKWSAGTTSETQEIYELWKEDQKLLALHFHPHTHSARIEFGGKKRVFMIRREGFLKNRIVLRNEYGMRLGQLHYEKSNLLTGSLELDGEIFTYTITQGDQPSIQMTRLLSQGSMFESQLENGLPLTLSGNLGIAQHAILMTTGWFMTRADIPEAAAL